MKIAELFDDLDIPFIQISSIRYDDNKGTSYFTNEMLSAGFKILNDEAIEIINKRNEFKYEKLTQEFLHEWYKKQPINRDIVEKIENILTIL